MILLFSIEKNFVPLSNVLGEERENPLGLFSFLRARAAEIFSFLRAHKPLLRWEAFSFFTGGRQSRNPNLPSFSPYSGI